MINNRNYDISRKDKSFKSFIISLLVFLVILVVILLVLTFYNKSKSEEKNKGSYDSQRGNIKTWTTDSEADSKTITGATKLDNFVENPIKNSHTTTNLVTDPATAFTKTNLGTTKSTDKPDMTTSSFVSDKSTISSGANIHKQNTTIYPTNTSDTTLSNFVTDTSVMPGGTISNSQNHVNTTDSSTPGFMTVTPLISTGARNTNIHTQNSTMHPATTTDTTLSNLVTDSSVTSSGTISNTLNHVNTTDSSTSNFMTVTPLISTGASKSNIHTQNSIMNPATTTDTTLSNFVTDTSAISSGTISNSQNHVTATDSSTTNFMTVVPLVSTGTDKPNGTNQSTIVNTKSAADTTTSDFTTNTYGVSIGSTRSNNFIQYYVPNTTTSNFPTDSTTVSTGTTNMSNNPSRNSIMNTTNIIDTTTPYSTSDTPTVTTGTTPVIATTDYVTTTTTKTIVTTNAITYPNPTTVVVPPPQDICTSDLCYTESLKIVSKMDPSKDACADFYEFACGGPGLDSKQSKNNNTFLLNYVNDYSESVSFLLLYQQFYTSCMEYDNEYNYKDRLQFVLERFNNMNSATTELFAETILTQSLPLFEINVDFLEGTDNFTLRISNGESGLRNKLKDWDYRKLCSKKCLNKQRINIYKQFVDLNEIYESYTECSKSCYISAFRQFLKTINDTVKIANDHIELLKINSLLEKISDLPTYMNQITSLSVHDLNKQMPILDLDWVELLHQITGRHHLNNLIQVENIEYFKFLIDEMTKLQFSSKTIKYLLLLAQGLTWYENTVIPKHIEKREFHCLEITKQLMPDITNYIFQSATPKFVYYNHLPVAYFLRIRSYIAQIFNNSKIRDVRWGDMLKNIHLVKETPQDKNFKDKLHRLYDSTTLKNDFQQNLYQIMKIYRKNIYDVSFSERAKSKLFTYFIDSYDEFPHTFVSINTVAVPLGMFHSVPESLPENIRHTKLTFRLARAIMKHFNKKTIEKMGDPIMTEYQTVLDHSLAADPTQYFGRDIELDVSELDELSAEDRLIETSAFSIADSLKPKTSKKLPLLSEYSIDQVFYITAAQEYCTEKEDLLDFLYKSKMANPLPAIFRIKNIVDNTKDFYNCTSFNEILAFPLYLHNSNGNLL